MDSFSSHDAELLERLKQNDAAAFKTLFDNYWEGLYLFAWKRLKSKQDAEDVVQHVFMKIWEHRATKNINFSLKAYLYKSVTYEVIATLKNMMDDTEEISAVDEQIIPAFNDIAEKLNAKELNATLDAEISSLPNRMQQVYRLSREENMSVREIASLLHVSEQTVKNQLTLVLARLRKPIAEFMILAILQDITIR